MHHASCSSSANPSAPVTCLTPVLELMRLDLGRRNRQVIIWVAKVCNLRGDWELSSHCPMLLRFWETARICAMFMGTPRIAESEPQRR